LLLPNQAITVRAVPQITTKRCHSHSSKTHKKQAGTDPQSGRTLVRSLQGYRFTVPENRRWPQLKPPKPKNETQFRSYSLTLHRIHVKLPGQLHILPLCPGRGDKNKYKTIFIYVQIKVIIIASTNSNSNSSAICNSRETGRQTERTFLRLARRGGGGGKKCAQAPLKRDKYCCEIESIWYTLTKNSEAHQNKKARAENTYYCQLIIYSRENCDINCCRNDISLCRLKGEREIFCIGRQTQRTFLRPVRRGGGGKVRTDHFET
jgi:hypothetical protein